MRVCVVDKFYFRDRRYTYRWDAPLARAVELPIIWAEVQKVKRTLEVGNVLAHWYPVYHTVLDKYEKAPGVINRDVVWWRPKKKYPLVVSISTLEHVGEGKDGNHQFKPLAAVYNLLLHAVSPGGRLLLTLPWGRRLPVDKMVRRLPFSWVSCMHRVGKREWVEMALDGLKDVQYNSPFRKANAVIIGELCR